MVDEKTAWYSSGDIKMNERIQGLARQADPDYTGNADDDMGNALVGNEAIEKFAKLIVKDCLNNMENCDGDLDFAIWKTKQDFGVKE
jgi:hypothetical protein